MKIVICSSINFTEDIKKIANELIKRNHQVAIPFFSKKILKNKISLENYLKIKKEKGDISLRQKEKVDLIKKHFNLIKKADAIFVLNITKNKIQNYIGGNTFLEMGFAHILNKKIYLYNNIPNVKLYKDEIEAINPTILNQDLTQIPSRAGARD